jgi:hypothetical protein
VRDRDPVCQRPGAAPSNEEAARHWDCSSSGGESKQAAASLWAYAYNQAAALADEQPLQLHSYFLGEPGWSGGTTKLQCCGRRAGKVAQ